MLDYNAAHVRVFCRDCGQPMAITQQDERDGSDFVQVTCWQPQCLLHGFTFSLDRYKSLKDAQLEAYRQMNRIYPPQYVRVDG